MSRLLMACVLAVTSTALADDKKPEPKGEPVSGTVTYKGQPIPAGVITFISKDGKTTVSAPLAEDGTYKATVPAGEYKVTVSTDPAVPDKKPDPKTPPKLPPVDPKKPPKVVVKIPAKYGDPKTTPLVITVKAGAQTIDIALQD
jgi:hypothetical protein